DRPPEGGEVQLERRPALEEGRLRRDVEAARALDLRRDEREALPRFAAHHLHQRLLGRGPAARALREPAIAEAPPRLRVRPAAYDLIHARRALRRAHPLERPRRGF